jgi:ribonuclease G
MFGWIKRNQMKREIIVNCESLEVRVALLENGRLEEFQMEHSTDQRIVGSIYKGRIQNLEHDLQAAFVDIGLRKNAFLHYWDMLPDEEALFDEEAEAEADEDEGRRRRRRPKRLRFTNQDIERRFPAGSDIVVQVTKGPIGTKGPRVTASLSIPGRHLVMMPGSTLKGVSRKIEDVAERQRLKKILERLPTPANMGVIARTAAAGARRSGIIMDLRNLIAIWDELRRAMEEKPAPACLYREPDLVERVVRDSLTEDVERVVVDSKETYEALREVLGRISRRTRSRIHLYKGEMPIFDHYGVEKQLEEAFRHKVQLKSGGYIVLDETEALVAVDVNTGRYKGSGSQEDAIYEVNTEAVEEVARQLRLRNIGGLVVIDLIDMKSRRHQHTVYRAMKAALKRDRARTNVLPISELGILEMTRQRAQESVLSVMYVDCPYCRGRGNVRSPLGMSVEIQRQVAVLMQRMSREGAPPELQVVVHPTVLERMRKEDEQFLLALQEKFEGRLAFKSDPSKHIEFFSIHNAATGELLYSTAEKPASGE